METIELTISELKSHLSEKISKVEKEGAEIIITRHGKSVAKITPDKQPKMTVADYMGSLEGTATFSPDHDPHEPVFSDDEWEMYKD